jgi:hypothetical protein
MATRLFQVNSNHAIGAQALFLHSHDERDCGAGVAAKLCRVPPDHPCWAAGESGSVAIVWKKMADTSSCVKLAKGKGFVMVK